MGAAASVVVPAAACPVAARDNGAGDGRPELEPILRSRGGQPELLLILPRRIARVLPSLLSFLLPLSRRACHRQPTCSEAETTLSWAIRADLLRTCATCRCVLLFTSLPSARRHDCGADPFQEVELFGGSIMISAREACVLSSGAL